ncbi:MAG: hypothetical protein KDN22_30260 [Verrucomicrobiae bacterium]|nr:hypothetical protein [Verrucomicrobiae bacterium]
MPRVPISTNGVPITRSYVATHFDLYEDRGFFFTNFVWKRLGDRGIGAQTGYWAWGKERVEIERLKDYVSKSGKIPSEESVESFTVESSGALDPPQMFDVIQFASIGNMGEIMVGAFSIHSVVSSPRVADEPIQVSNLCLIRSPIEVHLAYVQKMIRMLE